MSSQSTSLAKSADGTPRQSSASTTAKQSTQVPKIIRAVKDAGKFNAKGRNLIICLDGTGDKFDSDNSNIVHLIGCLKKSDPTQITYYQSGIGTYDGGGLSNGFNAAVDMAVGSGLGVHIRDAYRFLMQNYHEGDRICLFGFSRGAYTARCLAGMVHKIGLLPAHNPTQIPFAYQFYKDDSPEGWKMSYEFKRTFCSDVHVHFIGVFDSVASVGFIPRKLPLSSTPSNKPSYFRHAIALDEHRSKFKPCRYQQKDHIDKDAHWSVIAEIHERPGAVRRFSSNLGARAGAEQTNGIDGDATKKQELEEEERGGEAGDDDDDDDEEGGRGEGEKAVQERQELEQSAFMHAQKKADANAVDTDVLEVWFTGCHADVGGGAVKNEVRHKLSQIPLRWMIRQCFECDTGILFHSHRLAEEGLDVHTLYPTYTRLERPTAPPPPALLDKFRAGQIKPRAHRGAALEPRDDAKDGLLDVRIWKDPDRTAHKDHWVPEQVEDYFDAMSGINDQLVQAKGWWVLEFWPIKVRSQAKDSDEWKKHVALNLGRFRPVVDAAPNLHWTVQQRMTDLGYKMRTRVDRNAEWRIVV